MQQFFKQRATRALLLLLVITIALSSFCSCFKPRYTAETKGDITDNINSSLAEDAYDYDRVYEYLSAWGLPAFDRVKFQFFENMVSKYYNYTTVPDALRHAAATALEFLEVYYEVINLSDKDEVTHALLSCYAANLGDPYAIYRPAEETDSYQDDMSGKFGGIGVMIEYDHPKETITVSSVFIDSPAEAAGVEVGDLIYAIDGVLVSEIGYLNAVYHVRGEIGTYVELTLLRDGEYITVSVLRDEVEEILVDYDIDEEKNIGYVQIVSFKGNTFAQFKEAIDALLLAEVEGIIFDLRGNPGGYVYSVCDVISYLIPSGHTIMSYEYKNALPETEISHDSDGDGVDHVVDLPMVVIADENTASAGEIFTAALRDYDGELLEATIVGTTTYKKGVMQSSLPYALDGSTLTMTVAFYNPPCGVNYHGIGITPDVYVELPEAVFDEESGKYLPVEDTQLNAAILELEKLINAN